MKRGALSMICGDMASAQQQLQRVYAMGRHRRREPGKWSASLEILYSQALLTQQHEVRRCGDMLAVNFTAANDRTAT